MYSGTVDYETIAKVKQQSNIKVVGNGDITDETSYKKMLETGVDAVMIGRGALGNPNIFAKLKNKKEIDKFELIKTHISILKEHYDERFINATMKKHLLWYISGEKDASKIKLQVATNPSIDDTLKIVGNFLKKQGG